MINDKNDVPVNEKFGRRIKRRPITHHTITNGSPPIPPEIPSMSPERRNSYLSIAERRKYYNKTHEHNKKPKITEVELENQETTNREVVTSSVFDTLQTNEIPVSKKPTEKKDVSNRVLSNQGNNPKILLNFQNTVKPKKFQNTRQSVIQSQFEFGQKLNLKKSSDHQRNFDNVGERLRRNREKNKNESIVETTTTIITTDVSGNENYTTESIKLLNVNKTVSETTLGLQVQNNTNNHLSDYKNETNFEEFERYKESVNDTKNSNTTIDNQVSENNNKEKYLRIPIFNLSPLPLNFDNNSSDKRKIEKVEQDEDKQLASTIKNVYNQEILRLNSTRKSIKVPLGVLKSFNRNYLNNATKVTGSINQRTINISMSSDSTGNNNNNNNYESLNSKASDTIQSMGNPINVTIKSKTDDDDDTIAKITQISTQSVKTTEPTNENPTIKPFINESHDFSTVTAVAKHDNIVYFKKATGYTSTTTTTTITPPASPPPPPTTALNTSTTNEQNPPKYPMTIELNENNKRFLNEVFNVLKTTETTKLEKSTTDR
ncbi:conserved hypothetical protein [Pediculus humanus corporis]|uniref:Uncharacterized protein n=1 Tax=Pediculus humanus subsp. corporis TaxID=121224 RepID=E0VBB9_PEDHC|nr:uncharacterized protein Phum_PHUM056940 [Pediculus humanus corporis]EEB10675.1 conserved hypothetical protein [Pediculus humanus corporis]